MSAVVITGISTGIGRAAAEELAAHGYHVFGSVRRASDAEPLQARLGDRFTPLVFDVTDAAGIRKAAEQVTTAVGEHGLRGLVNNAGICLLGPLMHVPEREFRDHFEVNVFGLLNVTRAFLPLLGARADCPHPPGRIVNISSLSGRIAYPMFGAYASSKFAVEALSDSLRRELMLYGISVSLIEPGAIRTPIWDKGISPDAPRYENTDFGPMIKNLFVDLEHQRDTALPVATVTRAIWKALTARRPRTRYVIANSPLKRWWLPRLLPDRWLDFAVRKALKIQPPDQEVEESKSRKVEKSKTPQSESSEARMS